MAKPLVFTSLFCVFLLFTTGCRLNSQFVDSKHLPGKTFVRNSHTLTRSSNGVYIYKDNTIYDATRKGHSFSSNTFSSPDVSFGPGSMNFTPER